VDECNKAPAGLWLAWEQGLTLVHFSAQPKRCLWDRGGVQGLFEGRLGVAHGA